MLTQFESIEVLSIPYSIPILGSYLINLHQFCLWLSTKIFIRADQFFFRATTWHNYCSLHRLKEIINLNLRYRKIQQGDRYQFNLINLTRDQTPSRIGGYVTTNCSQEHQTTAAPQIVGRGFLKPSVISETWMRNCPERGAVVEAKLKWGRIHASAVVPRSTLDWVVVILTEQYRTPREIQSNRQT